MRNIEISISGDGTPNQIACRLRDLARELDTTENVEHIDKKKCEDNVLRIELKEN